MEQNNPHPLSPTQDDISKINPYKQSVQQTPQQPLYQQPVASCPPPYQTIQQPANGFAQSFPTTTNSNLPNSSFDSAVQRAKKMGRLSFIFGLISLFCMLAALIISETKIYTHFDILEGLGYLGYIVAVALSIPGVILGVKSLNRLKTGNPLAKAGLILSIITVIIIVILQIIISVSMITGYSWLVN